MNSCVVQQREGEVDEEEGKHYPTFKVPEEMKQCFLKHNKTIRLHYKLITAALIPFQIKLQL